MAVVAGYEIVASWGTSGAVVASNAVTVDYVIGAQAAADARIGAVYNALVAEGKNNVKVWANAGRYVDKNNLPT